MFKYLILALLSLVVLNSKYGDVDVKKIFLSTGTGNTGAWVTANGGSASKMEWSERTQRRLGRKIDRLIKLVEKIADTDDKKEKRAERLALRFCVNTFRYTYPIAKGLKEAFKGVAGFEAPAEYAYVITRWARFHKRETRKEHCDVYNTEIQADIRADTLDNI